MKMPPAGNSSTKPDGNVRDGLVAPKLRWSLQWVLLIPRQMKIVPAGASSAKPDGDVRDGACRSDAETVLPVGTSSTKTDDNCSSWYF